MLASLPWAKPVAATLLPPPWTDDAACRDLEPEEADQLFFPERGHSATKGQVLCRSCPVAKECLDMALTVGVEFGTFGGASARQRQALVKERNGGRPPAQPPKLCSMGCGGRAVARGLCQRHYDQERRSMALA